LEEEGFEMLMEEHKPTRVTKDLVTYVAIPETFQNMEKTTNNFVCGEIPWGLHAIT